MDICAERRMPGASRLAGSAHYRNSAGLPWPLK